MGGVGGQKESGNDMNIIAYIKFFKNIDNLN